MKQENSCVDPVLTLTEDNFLDYIKCPNYFYFKYMSKIPNSNTETYHSLLNKVIKAYCLRLFDGKVMTEKTMKKQWDKLIEEHPGLVHPKRILDGWGILNLFNRYCQNNRVLIADMDTPYQINIKNNIILKGQTGIIRLENRQFELFVVDTSQKIPDQALLNMSLKFTLQAYALKELSPNHPINCIKIYHVKSGQEFTTYRTQKDFERLENSFRQVGKAIREKIFYAREDFMCGQCSYKNYCGFI